MKRLMVRRFGVKGLLLPATLALLVLGGALAAKTTDELKEELALHFRQNVWHDGWRSADQLIAKEPKDGLHYFARGMAGFNMYFFEKAARDFERASALGVADSTVHPEGGDKLGDFKKWNAAAARLLPLVYTVPSGSEDYQIGIRSPARNRYARAAIAAAPRLPAMARKILGITPERVTMVVIPEDMVDEIFNSTKLSVSCSVPCPGAQVSKWTTMLYENHAGGLSDAQLTSTAAHEFSHAMHNYLKSANLGADEPTWWREGVAVYMQHEFTGSRDQDAYNAWHRELKAVGGEVTQRRFFGTTFHGTKDERLNYETGGLMVRRLARTKGIGVIAKIITTTMADNGVDFDDALKSLGGVGERQLFDLTVAEVKSKGSTGGGSADVPSPASPDRPRPGRAEPEPGPSPKRPASDPGRKAAEGDAVDCGGKSGRVIRTLGSRLLVHFSDGRRDVVNAGNCRVR